MRKTGIYIGYSIHWGLHALREDLARSIVTSFVLGKGSREGRGRSNNGLLNSDTPEREALSKCIEQVFIEIGKKGSYNNSLLHPVIDSVIDVEKVFLHTALSTGATSLFYHGNDANTPNNLTLERGKALLANSFEGIDKAILNKCVEESNDLFPDIGKLIQNRVDSPDNEFTMLCTLKFNLIDILVSLRTNSRLLLFNPKPSFDLGLQRLPAKVIKDLNAFYNVFQNEAGDVATPTLTYDIAGLNKDEFFGSEHFIEYCRSHDLLNFADPHADDTLRVMSRNVIALSQRFDNCVEKTTMNFALVKVMENLAKLLTSGISSYMKDFIEIVIKLCKERERKLVIYSGQNLKVFCEALIDERLGYRRDRKQDAGQG